MSHDHAHHGHACSHAHGHGHSHGGHGHHHGPASYDRAFAIGIALNIGFVLVEAFYGWMPVPSRCWPTPATTCRMSPG